MRAPKVDTNQTEIVKWLRDLGFSVFHTHGVGEAFPDLVAGQLGFNVLIEVKRPGVKLKPNQLEWHTQWPGWVVVIRTKEDCERLAHLVKDEYAIKQRGMALDRYTGRDTYLTN